ncbi:MAG: S9 family peptidase [Anaerolineae bacterium]|nr:S9 family peptidase [Anaerolineae bacterium]
MSSEIKRTITAEDLYQFQLISGCEISPDGRHVVFSLQRVDPKTHKESSNLWVVPTGGGPARQFTYGSQLDRRPKWSPDGREIAFVSNRGEARQPQIYLIPFHGGEARPLTQLKGEIGRFEWSPDGKGLVCNFRKKDLEAIEREEDEQKKQLGVVVRHITRIVFKEDGYGFLPQERWHIWTIDAASGEARQLTAGDHYDEFEPCWSPDGQAILFRSNRTGDPDLNWDITDLYIIPATIDPTELENLSGLPAGARRIPTPPGPKESPTFSPDGRWVAYYQLGGRSDRWRHTNLWVVPADGQGQVQNLTAPFDVLASHVTLNDMGRLTTMPPTWSSDSQTIYFQSSRHGNTILKSIGLDGSNLRDVIATPGAVEEFKFDQAQAQLVYLHGTMTDPGQIWLRDIATGQTRSLTTVNQALLESLDLGEVEEVWFKGAADNALQGWLLKPPGFDPAQKYPSILQIHGGPLVQFGNFFMHEFYFLAAQGYVVYFCNPRGGWGYGEDHARAIYNDWGGADYADLMAWTDFVQQQPYIDSSRLGVTGGSYGGFMTTWIIGHTDRFKAAVTQRSVSNMISMDGSSDLAYRFHALFGAEKHAWQDFDNYWRQSPLKYIAKAKTPTLVIHNDEDLRCEIEQGEQIFVALKKLGVETEMVRFPGEPHGMSRDGRTDRRIARLKHILRWFDRYLKAGDGHLSEASFSPDEDI